MELANHLEELAKTWGTDFFGVADLSSARAAIVEQGGPALAAYPRAISVGIALFHDIVDQLPQRAEPAVAIAYRHHCYDLINQRLDFLTSRLSSRLQAKGHRALPIPASKRVDNERLCGSFSHKLAARSAGLGWIGKSCLLVTPQLGPRVRWATVLTDAPLKATGEPLEEQCGTCEQCVSICPVKAFTGRPFREDEAREGRYDASKCNRYFAKLEAQGKLKVCGLCLYVCPHGRQ